MFTRLYPKQAGLEYAPSKWVLGWGWGLGQGEADPCVVGKDVNNENLGNLQGVECMQPLASFGV